MDAVGTNCAGGRCRELLSAIHPVAHFAGRRKMRLRRRAGIKHLRPGATAACCHRLFQLQSSHRPRFRASRLVGRPVCRAMCQARHQLQATSAQAAVAPQPVAAHPTMAQPPQQLPVSDDAKPLAPSTAENSNSPGENSDAGADQPRPLYSVMVRRDPKTATPKPAAPSSEVEPARYEETLPSPPARTSAPQDNSGSASTNVSAVNETPLDPEKVAAARAAADLLGTSFQPRLDRVTMITLLESINQAGESGRASAIQDYWRLWRAWADCNWAQDEEFKLEQVVPGRNSMDSPMLSTARAAAAGAA